MKLFDDDDGLEEDISKIQIDADFARRYEHNKKREDLQRLAELKKRGLVQESSDGESDDNSSSEESMEGELLNPKKDVEFLNALIKVKNQDPKLKEKEAKLFESDNEEEKEEVEAEDGKLQEKRDKRSKPMYLKDVAARLLIEEGPEFEEKEENSKVKSYAEEQEELRREFLDATKKAMDDVEDDDGEFFKMKESGSIGDEEDDAADEVDKKLDEYFGEDDNLDDNEIFLKDYFRNRMWFNDDKGDKAVNVEVLGFSEDDEAIEKQEDYEREFNFRFEENAGERVLGHSRFVEGSVRKKTNARKVQRKSKEERMAQAEFERKEELKRLKNLKKKELKEKLRKIRETAGIGEDSVCSLDVDDLDDEFDPEEHDRKMKEAFDDDYYGADDADPEFGSDRDEDGGLEKPNFDKEDELLGLPKGWDECSGDGFLAVRERNLKRRAENEGHHEQKEEEEEEEEEETLPEEGKRKKKRKMSKLEKEVLDKELEEYYKLDYEGTIGDLKTRFKYKEVGPKRYGLSAEEILMLDDKELNQYVSIKRLAPYREKEWKVDRNKMLSQKQRNKLLVKGEIVNDQKTNKNNLKIGDKNSQVEEKNGDTSHLSRKSRRRRRQAELKLSKSRLMAYGKIPSKSKSKKKH